MSAAEFAHSFARRTRLRGGTELTAILAGSPPGVLSMTGGFPNPATFPTGEIDEIAARLVREDASVALQYTPCAGIESVREYLIERHMPAGAAWTEPAGGFLTWLTLPEEIDTIALRPAAMEAGVAYVPGPPFHVGDGGRNAMRLSFSHLAEAELETAVERLSACLR